MSLSKKLFVLIQYALPHHLLSRLMGRVTRCRQPWFKNALIKAIVRLYGVDLNEAVENDPGAFGSFNEFFTRELKPGARPLAGGESTVVSPADGVISQSGPIVQGRLIQAKGRSYSLLELLGGSAAEAAPFEGGCFSTIYLSPRDYHRLHMPVTGSLRRMVHLPGRLFSVNETTVEGVPNLFARNERVIAHFETEAGPMALVMVGAIFVASIETVWHGVVTPPQRATLRSWDYEPGSHRLERGAEMGRFNMGSTIIVLLGRGVAEWQAERTPGCPVRMGEALGRLITGNTPLR